MPKLLHMLDKWTEYLENGGQIDIVYSDFGKAFAKVPPKRLLSELQSYNLNDMINWISDFFCMAGNTKLELIVAISVGMMLLVVFLRAVFWAHYYF